MESFKEWLLTFTVFAPTAGAIVIGFLDAANVRAIRGVALAASLITLVLAGMVIGFFFAASPTADYILEQDVPWIGPPGLPGVEIHYHLGVDGLSVFLLGLTAWLLALSVLYSFKPITDRVREYYFFLLILASACLGVFAAVDLLLFYLFFEFVLIPLYFLIGIWGGERRQWAATKFFVFTITGSLLTLAGVLYLAFQAGTFGGIISFEIPQLLRLAQLGKIEPQVQFWIFLALFAGFAVKVPLFPLHTWLPLAHTEAPTAGSVFLAGVLLKLGTYGFLRFALPLLPQATVSLAPIMAALAVVAILYGALAAWAQSDFKRLVAYSSVSHMGFCILGLFTLKSVGLIGAVLLMLNHGLSTGALFLVVGMIHDRYHTHRFDDLGGLASSMPRLAFFAVLFSLSSMGLPGLNGFVSEFMILIGAFTSNASPGITPPGPLHPAFGVLAAGGIALSILYILFFVRRVFFGPEKLPSRDPSYSPDLDRRETLVLAPLAVLVVLLGLWPGPIIHAVEPAASAIVRTILVEPQQSPSESIRVENPQPGWHGYTSAGSHVFPNDHNIPTKDHNPWPHP